MPNPIWSPAPERVRRANLTRMMAMLGRWYDAPVADFRSTHAWSVEHPQAFWEAVWRFCEVRASRPPDAVVDEWKKMPGARWFPGARLNFAENLLRYRDDVPALISWNERGPQTRRSYRQLYREVAAAADALSRLGVRAGDRVAGYLPNIPEAVIAMLAASSLGAIWSSCSPDFGPRGLLDRFGQIQPKLLITADGYLYRGKEHDCLEKVQAVRAELSTVERVVVIPYLRDRAKVADAASWPETLSWPELLGGGPAKMPFEQLPFDHPLYVLFSSGTTGTPKCIVHGAGGTLLQHLKELVLHTDLRREDRIFYYTTCGWMMWNWLASSLAVGATVLLYDGAPFSPAASRLFDLAEAERVTVFGTSAKYLSAAEKESLRPVATHDLSAIRTILSTGSPLPPEGFDYVYEHVCPDVCLSSISGGTDIISCFALGNPIGPVYRGELQALGLGMSVAVFDADGAAVQGEKGELVCTAPFPSMPLGFWNDPDGARYREAYFERYPGVWHHGDYAEVTDNQGLIIYGRSDAVLNPGGVRIGTAEIYRQVEQVAEVLESVAVAQHWHGDERVILFVKLRPDMVLDEPLAARIQAQIRRHTTPRHVPAKVIQVADLPRTKSGKIVEIAVRETIHNRPVKNTLALANPEALEYFRNLPELEA